MKKSILLTVLFAVSIVCGAQTFTLKSNDLGGQATMKEVFNGFGCTGGNISPQLFWENPPVGTKSFAVTLHDETAPTGGSGWWHWLVFDIDKNVSELVSGAGSPEKGLLPGRSIQSVTDFGVPGYGGPCPPEHDGFHKYTFTVYALSLEKLGLDEKANPALVGFLLEKNTIEKASMVFYFKR